MKSIPKGIPITDHAKWLKQLRTRYGRGQSSAEVYATLQNLLFAKDYAEHHGLAFDVTNFEAIYKQALRARNGINLGSLPKALVDDPDDFRNVIEMIGETRISCDRHIWQVFNNHLSSASLRKQDGQYFTPYAIRLFMCLIYRPTAGTRICDPCGGSGGMLTTVADLLPKIDPDRFFYNDSDKKVTKIAKIAFATYRHRKTDQDLSQIYCSRTDALDGPWPWSHAMDQIYTNVPFAPHVSTRRILDQYTVGRGKRSELPQLLFIEKCIRQLTPGGLLATVAEKGFVTNNKHQRARARLAKMAALEMVVELPGVAFEHSAGTTFPTFLLFFRKGEPDFTRFEKVTNIGYDADGYKVDGTGDATYDPFDPRLEHESFKNSDLLQIAKRWNDRGWPDRHDPNHDYPYERTLAGDWMWGRRRYASIQSRRLKDVASILKQPWTGNNRLNPTVDRSFRTVEETHLKPKPKSKVRSLKKGCLLVSRLLQQGQTPACGLIPDRFDGAGCTNENYVIEAGSVEDCYTIWFLVNFDTECHEYLQAHCRGQGRGRIMENDLLAMPVRQLTGEEMELTTMSLKNLHIKGEVDRRALASLGKLAAMGRAVS